VKTAGVGWGRKRDVFILNNNKNYLHALNFVGNVYYSSLLDASLMEKMRRS
jgi:hypothetical protein